MNTDIEVQLPDGEQEAPAVVQDEPPPRDAAWYEKELEDRTRRIGRLTARAKGAEETLTAAERRAQKLEEDLAEERRQKHQATQAGATFAEQTLDAQLAQTRDTLKRAYADGDVEAQVTATEAMADIKAQQRALKSMQPQRQERQEPARPAQQPQPQQQRPQLSARTQVWLEDNPWMKDADKSAEAMEVHRQILSEGVKVESADYFKEMTARTRDLAGDDAEPAPRKQAAGSGVSRTTTPGQAAPTKVRLTAEQVQAASDLNMSVEAYAARVRKLQAEGKLNERGR